MNTKNKLVEIVDLTQNIPNILTTHVQVKVVMSSIPKSAKKSSNVESKVPAVTVRSNKK